MSARLPTPARLQVAGDKSLKHRARCITLALALFCAACSDADPTASPSPAQAPSASAEPVDQSPQISDRTTNLIFEKLEAAPRNLDAMVEQRRVRILTVYGMARYYLDGATERGLVKEIAREFEDFINRKLQPPKERINVAVIPVARDQLIPALLEGKGDLIMAGLTITEERKNELLFSVPTSKPLREVLITGPGAPTVSDLNGLSGRTMYVRASSSYRESIEAVNRDFSARGLAPIKIKTVSELLEDEDLIEMVNAGMLPWMIVDDYKLAWWRDLFTDLEIREDIVFRQDARLGWAMRPENADFAELVNEFARSHRQGTMLGNVLLNRYVRDFDWAANATAPAEVERLAKLTAHFTKYGERYNFDPLFLAAQGYQESRLDQSARSRYGAIGVMQIKKSTARDPNVNIANIEEVEPNIHAGTRYMAFLRERYFSDPEIADDDRLFLSLAAYNMGPARLRKVRNKAAELGYDSNVWFDNVELATAKHVGREPVTYVANILKYYVAYSLIDWQLAERQEARESVGID